MSEEALAKVRKHFANFRDPGKLEAIQVPEWDLTIYYWPHLSMQERRSINVTRTLGAVVMNDETHVKMDHDGAKVMEVIARGRDEHGRLLFHESQFDTMLAEGDPGVIARITSQMKDEYSDPETVSKN